MSIYEFPVKKEPNPPPWGRSWAQNKSSQAARSADFRENSEWWTKIHPPTDLSVSGEECHSTIYWLITFFCFNWGQNYLGTPQNCRKMRRNLTLVVQFAYFSIRSSSIEQLLSNFRYKKQLFIVFWATFWEITGNVSENQISSIL